MEWLKKRYYAVGMIFIIMSSLLIAEKKNLSDNSVSAIHSIADLKKMCGIEVDRDEVSNMKLNEKDFFTCY